MRKTKTALAISLVVSTTYLAGCNDGSNTPTPSTDTASSTSSLLGSVFKGPIDNATIQITDATGKVLSSGGSQAGTFDLKGIELGSGAYFIQSLGGSYTDEATGKSVSPGASEGLMAVFTGDELRDIIKKKQYIAMTPETTIIASLVKKSIAEGVAPETAISEAIATIKKELIDGTNPASAVSGDEPLRIGNLATTLPADQKEALARNRAISFSYEAESLNLTPAQTLEIIRQRGKDLADGKLDGIADGNPVKIQDKDNQEVDFSKRDQKASFGLARARLFNKTIDRLRKGDISEAEKGELEKLGFNTDSVGRFNKGNEDAEKNTARNLAATNLPAFNRLPVLEDEDGNPDDAAATYTLAAKSGVNVTINVPGKSWSTPMLRYNGLQLPPIIRAKRGDRMTLNLVNDLKDETTIHWHGFKIPGDQDGGPDFPVAPNGGKTYSFKMQQPAAPLWFHPHPDMKTGEQVYRGLAGVFLLEDAISKKLEADKQLPAGEFDIPVLVQDRRFKSEVNGVRELAYKTMEMDSDGMMGNDILVNGAALPKLDVATRQYRFRIYNTSNARTYDFALHDGAKFKVVGTDGGLLPQPVETDHILLGAAERAEIIVDFSKYKQGDKVMLVSRAFNGSAMMGMGNMGNNSMSDDSGMGSGMQGTVGMDGNDSNRGSDMDDNGMGNTGSGMNDSGGTSMGNMNSGSNTMDLAGTNGANPSGGTMMNGMRMDIMRFDITADATDDITLYTALPATADINTQRLKASDASKTRNFVMTMANMGSGSMGQGGSGMGSGGMGAMRFVINGKSFDMNRIDELIKLSEGDTEIWSIQNMSPMAHPFHAHAIQWQILDRNGKPATGTDLGWKDTVLVQPGETVRFIGRFDPTINTGDYMYHCHILEHEDAGMMGFFRIQQ
jgi:FtsP/CotA-like multicopper oxidase with cupredoxin domain